MSAVVPELPRTLPETLADLRSALESTVLPYDVAAVEQARATRQALVDQLDDYVLPRLAQIDAPLLAVVGGSTGAGKSTLVNSLVRARVSDPGVLRPTTRSPVLVHHPDDARWFDRARILPELERTDRVTDDPQALRLVASAEVPAGLALLDAPDIDSVVAQNRSLAGQLLAAADLWLFVTSAARYADQVPWEFLRQAAERSAAVAIVLDRTPETAVQEVSTHLARMLISRGLKDSPLFTVPERLQPDGLLPEESVAEIRRWLQELGQDAEARAMVVRQTLDGAVRSVARRTVDVAAAVTEQLDVEGRLAGEVDTAYDRAVADVARGAADGTLLRGEVLARWQEYVGTGEIFRQLESKVSSVRDRLAGLFSGKPRPQQAERVTVAVESGLQTLVLENAESAAERVDAAWRTHPAGVLLLAEGRDLSRASRDLRERSERMVRDWQGAVLDLVRSEGSDRRRTARFLASGLNGLSVALMVVVFASTGGITGAEVGIAGGSAVLGQKVLEAVFGDDAVRRLAATARADLAARVEELFDSERRRYLDLLERSGLSRDSASLLQELAAHVDDLRLATPDGAR